MCFSRFNSKVILSASSVLMGTILFTALSANALTRTLTAQAEQARVTLESVAGKPDLYYLKVDNVESDDAGRVFVVKKSVSGPGGKRDDYSYPKLEFLVRLGGKAANAYTKPPVVGFLTFKNRDMNLSNDQREEKLAEVYAENECLSAKDKSEAEKAHTEALAKIKEACGTLPKLDVDWKSFDQAGKSTLACNAREALMALSEICADADYKKAASLIKTIQVKFGTGDAFKKTSNGISYTIPAFPENTRLRARVFFQDTL